MAVEWFGSILAEYQLYAQEILEEELVPNKRATAASLKARPLLPDPRVGGELADTYSVAVEECEDVLDDTGEDDADTVLVVDCEDERLLVEIVVEEDLEVDKLTEDTPP